MEHSVYKVTEIVGTSTDSWEDAVRNAVQTAGKTLRNLRVAEVSALDVAVDDGTVRAYRAKVKLSFKYEEDEAGEEHGNGGGKRAQSSARGGGARGTAASKKGGSNKKRR